VTRLSRFTVVLLVLALAATGCSVFGGGPHYEVQAQFPATFNLFPGSPVKVLGLQVGKVAEVDITPDSDLVTVTMIVDRNTDLPAEVGAIVVPESLLGERYVQFQPPYTGGDKLQAGALIPVDRTVIPAEFDEVLEGLNRFVGGIDEDSVGRLFANLAETLDGQGEEFGRTIDAAEAALAVLRDNDDDLIQLASRLADLNVTLATRDRQIGKVIQDFAALSRSLADDRVDIDRALTGLLQLSDELARLLETHREDLETDLGTLTRVGRTAQRNLDQVSLLVLSSAELYRHADRVIERDKNFLPLLNHFSELPNEIHRTVAARLERLCNEAGLGDLCDEVLDNLGTIIEQLCIPGLLLCAEEPGADAGAGLTLDQALEEIIQIAPPELGQEIVDQNRESDTGLADSLQEVLDRVLGGSAGLGGALGGGR
jgi:phospholipid/cholesterol/gamma-HCH transport system substrate-binding protein